MKKHSCRRLSLTLAVVALTAVVLPASASAKHSWASYHWAQANTSTANVSVTLGDNMLKSRSTDWPTIFNGVSPTGANVVYNWSNLQLFPLATGNTFADIFETPRVAGANLTSQKRCKPKLGRVEVCNARYGNNGWLGLAQIWTSGGHIVQGTAKLNDSYLDGSGYTTVNKQHVLCQEVGHTFGLGHTSEDGSDQNTCMDYASALDNPHTNAHDNEQIHTIYKSHSDPAGTTNSTTTTGTGKVRRLEKDLYVEEFRNGVKRFVFVTWKDKAAARRAPNHRIPE